jgi:hypothetical protein
LLGLAAASSRVGRDDAKPPVADLLRRLAGSTAPQEEHGKDHERRMERQI